MSISVLAPKGQKASVLMDISEIIAKAVAEAIAAQGGTPATSKVPEAAPKAARVGYFNVTTCERLKIARKVGSSFNYTSKAGGSAKWTVVEVPKVGGVLAEKASA